MRVEVMHADVLLGALTLSKRHLVRIDLRKHMNVHLSEVAVDLEWLDRGQVGNEVDCEVEFVEHLAPVETFNYFDVVERKIDVPACMWSCAEEVQV
jgi:hypothetical protein